MGDVMVSVLASSVVGRGFDPRSSQTSRDYTISLCCFFVKHTLLGSKDWVTRNRWYVSEWSDICTGRSLFQWAHNNPTKRIGHVQNGNHHLVEIWLVLAMIYLENCSFVVKQQSPSHSLTLNGIRTYIPCICSIEVKFNKILSF